MKINKKISLFAVYPALLFCVLSLISGCTHNLKTTDSTASSADSIDKKTFAEQPITETKLSIDEHRCSGCGKCFQIDPEHFTFDYNTGKAITLSSDNLATKNLKLALAMCHTRAITLQ